MSSDERKIGISVAGRADLGQASGEVDRFRKLIEGIRKEVSGLNTSLKDLAMAGAVKGIQQGLDYTRQLTAGSLTGGAMYGRISGGLSQYKSHVIEIDNEARSIKRLGEAYRSFHQDLIATGRAYGFSNQQVLGLASMYGQTNGRAGAGRLAEDMRTTQGLARAYGMQATEAGGYLNQANRAGIVGPGSDVSSMRQFSALLADAISAGGMQGREGEVMSSVIDLTRAINSQTVKVGGTTIAASALTTLNQTGIRGLQGENGETLLGKINSAIQNPSGGEAGNLFMYRALTGGKGGMNLADYSYLKEEGLAGQTQDGKSNLQAVMEAVNEMPIKGRYRLMAASNLTGMSMHQMESLEGAFFKDGKFDMAKMGGLQGALGGDLGNVDPSTWGLLADLQNSGNVGDIGKEFEQLSGQKAATSKDELFNQIKEYGKGNVALSQGQEREKLDNDIAKASEDAASKLYDLQTAADQLAKKLIEMGGSLPGPLGGIAPIVAGSAMGGLLNKGTGMLAGKGASLLGRVLGLGGGGMAAAEVAAGAEAGTAVAGAAGAGGMGLMGSILPPVAAAIAGSEIGQSVYGNKAGIFDGIGTAGQYLGSALSDQWSNATSGNWGAFSKRAQQFQSDMGNTAGGIALAGPGAIGGTLWGAYKAATGQQDFQSAYRDGLFTIDRFDSQGRREWQAAQTSGGGAGAGWGNQGSGADQAGDQPAVERIDKILKGSGMAGKGALLLNLSKRYGVPVELALAQFAKESQFSTTGVAPKNNNPGNLRYTGNWGDDRQGAGGFAHFPSVDAGIEGYFMLLGTSKTYQNELAYGKKTGNWSSLVNKYAPPTENDSKLYANQMQQWTQMYHQQIAGSSRGGWWDVPGDELPTLLHRKEMVLPQYLADPLRKAITSPQLSDQQARAGGNMIRIQIEPIQIRMPDGSTQTARGSAQYVPFDGVQIEPMLSSR